MPSTQTDRPATTLLEVSSAIRSLHKQQFGCEPAAARSYLAGRDTLICVLEDALLPAEQASVQQGDAHRVRDSRGSLQAATARCFIETVEELTGRTVHSFASAMDPQHGVVTDVFILEALDGDNATARHDAVRAEAAALVRESERMRTADTSMRRNLDAMRDGARAASRAAYADRHDPAINSGRF